ncbi:MAG: hypothetical protein H6907_15755 [Hyphomicrobiales bacterium]|nr:hypothetical protein [Hyphomicrobiales bacterium]MCP5373182.1 hypothetical protein [Hyphomicrobiales bacterium]
MVRLPVLRLAVLAAPLLAVLLLAALLLAALAPAARAGYVFYYRVFGTWTVTCWQDEPTGRKDCNLTAPPADLSTGGGRSKVAVWETAPGAFALSVQLRGVAIGSQQVLLTVDGGAGGSEGQTAATDHAGLAGWDGAAALALVGAMRGGQALVLREQPGAGHPVRQETIPLDGFAQALDVYRLKVRGEGIIQEK